MKKLVVKLDLPDNKAKQKALKTASTLQGIDFISMDMKEKKMTVIGTVDPVSLVSKLRKYWHTDIITVGPAKEPEPPKKEDPPPDKKDEEPKELEPATPVAKQEEKPPKDEEPKKEEEEQKPTPEEPKKEEEKENKKDQEEEGKKLHGEVVPMTMALPPEPDPVLEMVRAYRAYHPQMNTYYYAQSMEENPNACVIS